MSMIRRSKSPVDLPMQLVSKSHGRELRLYADYRGLNQITILNRYPLLLINKVRNRVHGTTMFTMIDLKSGYNPMRIKEGVE